MVIFEHHEFRTTAVLKILEYFSLNLSEMLLFTRIRLAQAKVLALQSKVSTIIFLI